tara:strand:- start:10654 stop:11355 length:702 start_codon:yes stop_codon:yes gene_type:complete
MMDYDRWVNTLHSSRNKKENETTIQIDENKWVSTISKPKKNDFIKKYSFTTALFVFGLIFVSMVKEETRNLQKEVDHLMSSISILKSDLHKSTLDYDVITSPENIKNLAEKYLESDLVYYKKSQIEKINHNEIKNTSKNTSEKNFIKDGKRKIAKKIQQKKVELKKLQQLYEKPEELPDEIKTQIVKKINLKKEEIKRLYESPRETITVDRVQKWAGIQIVKAFLGIPIVPGK